MLVARHTPALGVILALVLPRLAAASWLPDGYPVCDQPAIQVGAAVTSDGTGGTFIAWADRRNGNQFDIYLQHMTSLGDPAPGWPSNGIPVCTAPGNQQGPVLLGDDAGGVYVAWLDQRALDSDVYAQHVTAGGGFAPGWPLQGVPLCVAPGLQNPPVLVRDDHGGLIAVWADGRVGNDVLDVYAQHLTPGGTLAPGWVTDGNVVCAAPGLQTDVAAVPDGLGGAIVAWDDARAGVALGEDVYVQHLTVAGAPAPGWPANGEALFTDTHRQIQPQLVVDGSGGAIAVWEDDRVDPETDLYAKRLLADGTFDPGWPATGAPVTTAPSSQFPFTVASDDAGGVFVAWDDRRSGVDDDVYVQHLAATGQPASGWDANGKMVDPRPGYQNSPFLARDGFGGVFLAWSWGTCCDGDLRGIRLGPDGAIALGFGPSGVMLRGDTHGSGSGMALSRDEAGGAVLAWSEARVFGANPDIYASRMTLTGDLPTPVMLSLVSADVVAGEVRLAWFTAEHGSFAATVERRGESSDWTSLGRIVADGDGRLGFVDRGLAPGRYAYRLTYDDGGVPATTAESWVVVPVAAGFALAGARPNPVSGDPMIRFSLPSGDPATLEMCDLAGRRIATREVGGLGAGEHTLRITGSARLAPGVYWVRLTQAGRSAAMRVVVTR
ncbi:MAG: hypothetical protein ACHQ52_08520 [Candidatus Eisenbacteria bacterium]